MGNLSIAHSFGAPTVYRLQNIRLCDASPRERTLPQLIYRGLPMEGKGIQSDAGLTFDERCNFFVRLEFFNKYPRRCCIFAPDTQRPCRA